MSEFNKYARKLDEIAREALTQYEKAAKRKEEAEKAQRAAPERQGLTDATYAARAARARADALEAEQGERDARRAMDESYRRQIAELRGELVTALDEAFRADPQQIDNATLELLKSGICTPTEYAALLDKALASDNHTMARLIGKYASDAAAAAQEAAGGYAGDATATALRAVSYKANGLDGKPWLEAFDFLESIYSRAVNEPFLATVDRWDKLTSETIERF